MIVSGKHISETGLSFFHPEPLPYRLVAATLEKLDGTRCEYVIDVGWCRFTQMGWYESGGKFVRQIEGPATPSAAARSSAENLAGTGPASENGQGDGSGI